MGSGSSGILPSLYAKAALQRQQQDLLAKPPPPAPDVTDKAVQLAAAQQLGGLGRGRRSTFLGGDYTVPSATQKTLLGGG